MNIARVLVLALALGLMAGCSQHLPDDVAGEYQINLVNSTNGCMFMDWDGMSTNGVPLTITQSGRAITGVVGGVAAVQLDVLFGGHTFVGNVIDRNDIDMILEGTTETTIGACTLSLDAHASVSLNGDALTGGTITYTYRTQGDTSTCPAYTLTCESVQRMNGIRSPSI